MGASLLVRLPNLGVYCARPTLTGPERSREFFGLRPGRHVYLGGQTRSKFHPDFDAVLRGILEVDPLGDPMITEARVAARTQRSRTDFNPFGKE